jgi:hypothetical protein
MQGSPVDIQTASRCNLICRSTTVTQPVLPPSSILPPLPPHRTSVPKRKNAGLVSETLNFFPLLKLPEPEIA